MPANIQAKAYEKMGDECEKEQDKCCEMEFSTKKAAPSSITAHTLLNNFQPWMLTRGCCELEVQDTLKLTVHC